MSLVPNFDYFYFIRHGQTDANKAQILAGGNNDVPLNSDGETQAHQAAQILIRHCSDIQTVYGSPMTRTKQTAEIILSYMNRPFILDENLVEWRLGEWEGRPWNEVAPLFLDKSSDPEFGEGRKEFRDRVLMGIQGALQNTSPVLIVAHGGIWYMLQKILNLPLMKSENCQIFKVQKDPKSFFSFKEITL